MEFRDQACESAIESPVWHYGMLKPTQYTGLGTWKCEGRFPGMSLKVLFDVLYEFRGVAYAELLVKRASVVLHGAYAKAKSVRYLLVLKTIFDHCGLSNRMRFHIV